MVSDVPSHKSYFNGTPLGGDGMGDTKQKLQLTNLQKSW